MHKLQHCLGERGKGGKIKADRRVLIVPVSYTHLRAHETGRNLVCRLLLEKKIPLSGINNDNDNDHIVKTTSNCIFNNYSSESIAHEAEG